jgi:hypothetical protein
MDRNDVKIGSPCSLDWRKMTPAEGGRFCGDCKKVVRDLSTMTERQARAMLAREGGGELCVRYIYDDKGRIFFGGDAPLLAPSSLLVRARRVAAAAAVVALPFATQACEAVTEPLGVTTSPQRQSETHVPDRDVPDGYNESMGGVSYDPTRDLPLDDPGAASPDASRADGASEPDGDAGADAGDVRAN